MKNKEILEIAGIVAVVASLLFLAYEIRQSNRIASSTISYEIGNNYSELNEIIWTNPQVAELHVKIQDPDFKPTEIEEVMLGAEVRRFMNVWTAIENAYRNGHQSRLQLEVAFQDVDSVLTAFPAIHHLFRQEFANYPGLADNYEVYQYARQFLDTYQN